MNKSQKVKKHTTRASPGPVALLSGENYDTQQQCCINH